MEQNQQSRGCVNLINENDVEELELKSAMKAVLAIKRLRARGKVDFHKSEIERLEKNIIKLESKFNGIEKETESKYFQLKEVQKIKDETEASYKKVGVLFIQIGLMEDMLQERLKYEKPLYEAGIKELKFVSGDLTSTILYLKNVIKGHEKNLDRLKTKIEDTVKLDNRYNKEIEYLVEKIKNNTIIIECEQKIDRKRVEIVGEERYVNHLAIQISILKCRISLEPYRVNSPQTQLEEWKNQILIKEEEIEKHKTTIKVLQQEILSMQLREC